MFHGSPRTLIEARIDIASLSLYFSLTRYPSVGPSVPLTRCIVTIMPVYGIINYKSVTTITSRNVPARPLPRFSVTRNWSAKFAKLTAIWISSFSKFVECSRRMRNLRGGEEGEKRAGGSRVAGCGICDRTREEKSLGAASNGFRELSPARRRFPRAPDPRFLHFVQFLSFDPATRRAISFLYIV